VRVLVVEDERSVATGVKRALVAEGYDVDTALDGESGLELARSQRYDLIVLDVMLPKVNGYEICRSLRADGDRVPIVMLTAKTGQWDIVEGLDLGADDYLTKPFSMAVLLARVRARTRRATAHGNVLVNGDLRLDTVLQRCWREDVEIELTGRETRLLGELFRCGGEVVAKAELLRLAWGDGFQGDPNVVEVYVGRLRRKVDAPFGANDIETIRGVGYRLRAPRSTSKVR
jgi:DNA-binding response OmpR family regulator